MKYYIIAGEASGDLHGSHLIKGLIKADPQAEIRCWGGDRMQQAGGHVVKHIRHLAYMGFWEVVKHLGAILQNIRFCKQDIISFRPDVVILIDYPGFNFRLLRFLHQNSIKTFYYVSPQLWAWKTGRIEQVRRYVDRMFVIFPFEKEFYRSYGIDVDFNGHPLLDEMEKQIKSVPPVQKTIALLPGSRRQEIAHLLPEYLKVIPHFPQYRFVVAGMKDLGESFYRSLINGARCELIMDKTYEVLQQSNAAIVTSGTATLETALHRVPQVVCYKGSIISYFIARLLIKNIRFICIVNLIANSRVVEELIQNDVNEMRLISELKHLISENGRQEIIKGYDEVRHLLGSPGASERTARCMVQYLKEGIPASMTT